MPAFERKGDTGTDPAAVQQEGPFVVQSERNVAVQRTPVPGQEPSLVTADSTGGYMP